MASKSEARAVVEQIYADWAARNLEAVLEPLADDIRFTIHPEELDNELPFVGTRIGKAAVAALLSSILDQFDFDAYVPERIWVDGPVVRASIVFYYRDRLSGEPLDGRFRHVWRVENGVVQSCDEYHDVALLRSYMRMVQWRRQQRDQDPDQTA